MTRGHLISRARAETHFVRAYSYISSITKRLLFPAPDCACTSKLRPQSCRPLVASASESERYTSRPRAHLLGGSRKHRRVAFNVVKCVSGHLQRWIGWLHQEHFMLLFFLFARTGLVITEYVCSSNKCWTVGLENENRDVTFGKQDHSHFHCWLSAAGKKKPFMKKER